MREADHFQAVATVQALVDQVTSGQVEADGPKAAAVLQQLRGALTALELTAPPRRSSRKQAIKAMTADELTRIRALAPSQAYLWSRVGLQQAAVVRDPDMDEPGRQAAALALAVSVRNVYRAAVVARDVSQGPRRGALTAALRVFDLATPNASKIRNGLEHFDDYALGIGVDRTLGTADIFIERRSGGQYLLHLDAYELDVETAAQAAAELGAAVAIETILYF